MKNWLSTTLNVKQSIPIPKHHAMKRYVKKNPRKSEKFYKTWQKMGMNQQFYTPGTSPLRKVVTVPLDRLEEMHGLNTKFPALAKGRDKDFANLANPPHR